MNQTPNTKAEFIEGAPESVLGFIKQLFVDVDKFFFAPSSPSLVGLLRLFAGLTVFYIHLTYSFDLMSTVGPDAWIDQARMTEQRSQSLVYAPSTDWSDYKEDKSLRNVFNFSIFYHVNDSTGIWAVHIGILVANLMFALGLFTRTTAVLTWIGLISYIQRAPTHLFGMDTIAAIFCLYLMIGPGDQAFSLDTLILKLRRKKANDPNWDAPPKATGWATFVIRLMQIHLSIIYLASGTSKLMGGSWWNGNALWSVMANYEFNPMDSPFYTEILRFLANNRPLWEVAMTAGCVFTLFLELAFPFLVWYPRWRWVMMAGAILLHTGIGILMGLTMFSTLMILLVASFLPPEVAESVRQTCSKAIGLCRPVKKVLKESGANLPKTAMV